MKKRKALIADDDRHVRVALKTRLESWGYNVVETANGFEVMALATRESVDVLILDHEMPLGDGQAIARVLRQETDVPVIFLSGHPREEFRDITASLHNVHFVPKPFDGEALKQLLDSVLNCPATLPAFESLK